MSSRSAIGTHSVLCTVQCRELLLSLTALNTRADDSLTSSTFRSDLSPLGSGVLAASSTQLTKIVNKMKYSKGLVSVKEIYHG